MTEPESQAVPPMLRAVELTLRTDCPRCGAHLPVNGVWSEVACADCRHVVQVPGGIWRGAFEAIDEGRDGRGTTQEGDLTWRWSATASSPACPACETGIPIDVDVPWRCPCGTSVPVEARGARGRKGLQIRRTIAADDGSPVAEPEVAPVAMQCPNCTAGLRITQADQRLTDCAYCGTQIHLPDGVWRALHPARTVRRWWAVVEGPIEAERKALKQRQESARVARTQAENDEKRRKRAEVERRAREAREARRAEDDAARAAADRRHHRLTLGAMVVAWIVVAAAGLEMLATLLLLTYGAFLPIDPIVLVGARTGLLVTGAACGGVAWGVALGAAGWRARAGVLGYLAWGGLWLALGVVPVFGMLATVAMSARMALGWEPSWDGWRRTTRGGGVLLAVTLFGVCGYVQIAMASFFGMTVFDFWLAVLEALPDD